METTHRIVTENAYGATSIPSKIFTTIISIGMCWLDTTTRCVCCTCGKSKEIE